MIKNLISDDDDVLCLFHWGVYHVISMLMAMMSGKDADLYDSDILGG